MNTISPKPGVFDVDLHHKDLYFRRTKIVATIGPASSSPEKLRRLISKSLDVARINFSHGKAEDHLKTIQLIRKISGRLKKPVAILGDLCGPKIRVGEFVNGSVTLREGSVVTITTKPVIGTETLIPSQYKNLVREVVPGHSILLDDGNLELKVVKKYRDRVEAKVIHGGVLKNKKGMNLPNTLLRVAALTAKDKNDVLYCIKGGVDYIALSFVRKPADIRDLKNLLNRHRSDIPIIAKIEMPEALTNIQGIMELADGIMVARGDLGVELPAKKVPIIQNKLIQIANTMNKPVIVATQMLESMIENPQPTRAEASDVANAIWDGTDAVMLSAESAVGKHPLEAVRYLDSIAADADAHYNPRIGLLADTLEEDLSGRTDVSVAFAACRTAEEIGAKLIVVFTEGGGSARLVSRLAANIPVIGATTDIGNARRMGLLRGVESLPIPRARHLSEMLASIHPLLKTLKGLESGDRIVMTLGHPLWTTGTTNMMRVETY